MWKEDQDAFPLQVLSFDTEQVPITQQDWIAFSKEGAKDVTLQRNQRLTTRLLLDNDSYIVKDRKRNPPRKIFFGDGLRWTAMVSLPFKRMENRKESPLVAEFFNNLPGLSVSEDCRTTNCNM